MDVGFLMLCASDGWPGISDGQVYDEEMRLSLLAEELGAYPSPETETVYLDILRSSPGGSIAEVDQLDADGLVVLGQMTTGTTVTDLHVGARVELAVETLFADDEHEYTIWKWRAVDA